MNASWQAPSWCKLLQAGKHAALMAAISGVLAISGLGPMGIAHASSGTATLSLSPDTQTNNVGDTVQFDIIADISGDTANAVQANLDYPSGVFDSGSASCGTDLSLQAQSSVSAGVVKLACATQGGDPAVSGTITVGTVTLHAAATATPSAPNVTFRVNGTSESVVTSSTDSTDILTSTTGGTYTIDAAPSGGSTGGGGTSGGSTSGTSGSTSGNSKTPKAPNTGFALFEAHPVAMLGVTTLAAALIFGVAQRVRRLASERAGN